MASGDFTADREAPTDLLLCDLPGDAMGFEVIGLVTADDYRDVITFRSP